MRGSEDERERSGMVDSRAETSSLSDKTEFTETEDQGAMHHGRNGRSGVKGLTLFSVVLARYKNRSCIMHM